MGARISIVVPTRDTCALTLQCLRAVLAANLDDAEIIVVDDGSRDGTAEQIRREIPDVRVLVSPTSLGFTASANRGLAEASGDLLLLLNSDTEVAPDAPAKLAAALASDPRLGVCGPQLVFDDGSPQWSSGTEPDLVWYFALASGIATLAQSTGLRRTAKPGAAGLLAVAWLRGAALMIRREAWREVGPFDARYRFYCQDLDFCLSLARAGWGVALVPAATVVHHQGATISRDRAVIAASRARTERYHAELLWTDFVRLEAKRGGVARARSVARALRTGARIRIAMRRLAASFRPRAERERYVVETASFERALAAIGVEIDAASSSR